MKIVKKEPELYYFMDDGKIPNNKFPLLLYREVFSEKGEKGAKGMEELFANNNWTNSWRNGIYHYHHYHSTAHEVLGIYEGTALLKLGGEEGNEIHVTAGDIIVIPAGVGHKNIRSKNLEVIGAYAGGRDWDVLKGNEGERPKADENIAGVPFPDSDPVWGTEGGLINLWKVQAR
jgi:uncharacterized protein YjlB